MHTIDNIKIEKIQISKNNIRLVATLLSNIPHTEFKLLVNGKEKYTCNLIKSSVPPADSTMFSYYFDIEIPLKEKKVGLFVVKENNKPQLLKCSFHGSVGLKKNRSNRFIIHNKSIIKYSKGYFYFYTVTKKELLKRFILLVRESIQKRSLDNIKEYKLSILGKIKPTNNSIGIISTRGNGKLTENMASIVPFLNHPINYYLYDDGTFKSKKQMLRTLRKNKVAIIDDYNFFLRKYDKNDNQKIIQLWHAAGAFKHFGKDGSAHIPVIDAEYHKGYDLVTVSSDQIQSIYADAFAIDVDKVLATGVARTDILFDEEYKEKAKILVYQKYPVLKNKEVILYAPTFRDSGLQTRETFIPDIDFENLSSNLNDNQVFIICPHPVMTDKILNKNYKNIIEIRDLPTSEIMLCSDLLITDYSSIIFDYCLLNKPIAFYCYDINEYNRDFYLQYPDELPGQMLTAESDLINYICGSNFTLSDNYSSFKEKYMSACDGNSSKRIADIINRYMDDGTWI